MSCMMIRLSGGDGCQDNTYTPVIPDPFAITEELQVELTPRSVGQPILDFVNCCIVAATKVIQYSSLSSQCDACGGLA